MIPRDVMFSGFDVVSNGLGIVPKVLGFPIMKPRGVLKNSFIRGGSNPFYIPFFLEKAPLSYTFYWKKAPLSYTFLRRLMNKSLKQEVFLSFFHVARNKLK